VADPALIGQHVGVLEHRIIGRVHRDVAVAGLHVQGDEQPRFAHLAVDFGQTLRIICSAGAKCNLSVTTFRFGELPISR
jgi:hypothetical protein